MPQPVPSPRLPRFLVRGRRGAFGALIGAGIAVALLSAGTARMVSVLSHEQSLSGRILLVGGVLALIAGVAGLRVLERFLAEKLGQGYVHEIRKELIRSALAPGRTPSLGITVARTSNDLNSVRNWVTLGIASAASGIPLIAVLTVALWLMAPLLAVAIMAPLVVGAALLGFLSRPMLIRAAALRKARGRLAGHVTDTVNASVAIRAAGGEDRELGRIDRLGKEVAASAIRRATLAGGLRASAAAAASATAVAVAATGAFIGLDGGHVAAALTVVSMIANPVHDLGRIVEFRQNYLAARAIIAPALARRKDASAAPRQGAPGASPSGVSVAGLPAFPEGLHAEAGECVRVMAEDHAATDGFFRAILDTGAPSAPVVSADGNDLASMDPTHRRRYLGYAARGLSLERGQLGRAVKYRRPDTDDDELARAIDRVGLGSVVARLPAGTETVLRRGGEPLSTPERAKVQLARASLDSPPLLLLNRIDADLDDDGRAALRSLLQDYSGVAVVATDHPDLLPETHTQWRLDAVSAGSGPRLS